MGTLAVAIIVSQQNFLRETGGGVNIFFIFYIEGNF
jgi:hypothetical protein